MSQVDNLQVDTEKLPEHILEGEEEADQMDKLRTDSSDVADALRGARKVEGSLTETPSKSKAHNSSPSKPVTPKVRSERLNTSALHGPDPLKKDKQAPHDRSRFIPKGTFPRPGSENTAPIGYAPVRSCKRSDLPDNWNSKIPLKNLKVYNDQVVSPPDYAIMWRDPYSGEIQWLWPSCSQEDGDQAFVDDIRDLRFGPTGEDGVMTTSFPPDTHVILNIPQFNVATATAFVTHDQVIDNGGKLFQRVEIEEWPSKCKHTPSSFDQLNCVFWPVEYLLELHDYTYSNTRPYIKLRRHPNAWQISDLRNKSPESCAVAREGKFYIFMGLNPDEEYVLGDLCDQYGDRQVPYGDSIIAKLDSLEVKNKKVRDHLDTIDNALSQQRQQDRTAKIRRSKEVQASLRLEIANQAKLSSGEIHKRITSSQAQINQLKKAGELKRVSVGNRRFLMAKNATGFRKAVRKSKELEMSSESKKADSAILTASSQPTTSHFPRPASPTTGVSFEPRRINRSRSLSPFFSESWKSRWNLTDGKMGDHLEPEKPKECAATTDNNGEQPDLPSALAAIECLQREVRESNAEKESLEQKVTDANEEIGILKQRIQELTKGQRYSEAGEIKLLSLATSFDEVYTKFNQLSLEMKQEQSRKEEIDVATVQDTHSKLADLVARLDSIVTNLEPRIIVHQYQEEPTNAVAPHSPIHTENVEENGDVSPRRSSPTQDSAIARNEDDLVNTLFSTIPPLQSPTVTRQSPDPSPVPSDGILSEPSITDLLRSSRTLSESDDSDSDCSAKEDKDEDLYKYDSDDSDQSAVGEITEEKMRQSKDPLKLWSKDALGAWLPIDCSEDDRSLMLALYDFYRKEGSHEAFRDMCGNLHKARPGGKWSGISITDEWLGSSLVGFRLLECSRQLGKLVTDEDHIMAIRWLTFKAPKFNWQRLKLTRDVTSMLDNVSSMLNNEYPEIADGAILSDFLFGRGLLAKVLPFDADKVRDRLETLEGKKRPRPSRRATPKEKKTPLNLEMVQKSVLLALKGGKRKSSVESKAAAKKRRKQEEEEVEVEKSDRDEIMEKRTKVGQKKIDSKKYRRKTPGKKSDGRASAQVATPALATPLIGRVARKQVGGKNGKKVELLEAGKYSQMYDAIKGALDRRLEQCLTGPPRKRADRPFGQLRGLFNVGLHDLLFKRLTKGMSPDIRTFGELNASLTLLKSMMKELESDKAMARLVIKQFPWVELLLVLYIAWRLEKVKKDLNDGAIYTLLMGYKSESGGKYPGLLDTFRQSCHMWAGRLECIRIGIELGGGHQKYSWRVPDARADFALTNGLQPMDATDTSGNPVHVYPEYKVMAWMLKNGIGKIEFKTHKVLKRKPLMDFKDGEEEGEGLFEGPVNTQQVTEELGLFLEKFDDEAEMPSDPDWEKDEKGDE